MRWLGSVLSGAGLLVVACVVPDVGLVHSFAAGASAGGAPGAAGTSHAGTAGRDAELAGAGGAAPATDGGAPPTSNDGGQPNAGAAGETGGEPGEPDDTAPSCAALSKTACHGESCCTSTLVPGCSACQLQGALGASVDAFKLDKYEATVGRFREFVKAYAGPPPADAGAHPQIAGSGWLADWNDDIAVSSAELATDMELRPCKALEIRTWTKTPGDFEQKPITCLTWYEAFAFCAWDGGFLPSELEWHFAATGGGEERKYPWVGNNLDPEHALYGACGNGVSTTCDETSILEVGSKPAGAGKWGHLDMAGSVWEWLLDSTNGTFPAEQPCSNCANLASDGGRRIAGSSWVEDASYLPAAQRLGDPAESVWYNVGIRCARLP
jgi:formylglycine-generating enzyme required for sulfatase activity